MADNTIAPVMSVRHLAKSFGSVRAVRDISLDLHAGSVLALMGENGAGKSTIISMLTGRQTPDSGTILIRGEEQHHLTPTVARRNGVRAVLQDFSLVPTMSVAQNLFLNQEVMGRFGFVDSHAMNQLAARRLDRVGAGHIAATTEIAQLSRAEQQLVEIAKAVDGPPGVLLLDEPTASITESETVRLFELVDQLRDDGWAILYISHRMDELRRIADMVTVIRDGQWVSTSRFADTTPARIVTDMVGREMTRIYPERSAPAGTEVLSIRDLHTRDGRVRGVDVQVCAGEVVGIGGLVGCGKREVANIFFGLSEKVRGEISLNGEPVSRLSARRSATAGIGFIPEDRKREANLTGRPVEDNISTEVLAERRFSPGGFLARKSIRRFASELATQLDIRPSTVTIAIDALSGGNQQKVVLARALSRPRSLYLMVEPTAGVDVGARADIYSAISALAESGAAVLLISSDVEELVGLADRVYVMHEGTISTELSGEAKTAEHIVAAAFAGSDHELEGTS
jgi:ribose transport system ATP-binding protein